MRVTYPVKRYRDADFIECKVEITEDNLHDISERPSQSSHHTTTTSPLRMSSRSFPSPPVLHSCRWRRRHDLFAARPL
jgi:hypothetical protein